MSYIEKRFVSSTLPFISLRVRSFFILNDHRQQLFNNKHMNLQQTLTAYTTS